VTPIIYKTAQRGNFQFEIDVATLQRVLPDTDFDLWAATLESSPPAATSSIEPAEVCAVLAAAVTNHQNGAALAEHLQREELNRGADFLAAAIVRAALLAA
jgi:hypothetical protein